jgi:demethylmenaquinone methyltransferase/2-methoxy-6-polyprenyl-1,4-benzoquinol methylase
VFGLGYSYWDEVISVLREIIPVYDKVNKVISLGKDESYRLIGIKKNIHPGDLILDAGSGFGNMSITASKCTDNQVRIVMFDPILEMLKNPNTNLAQIFVESSGIFEYLPFRNETFDVVMCGYTLRDAIELEKAISEVYRILKKGGRFIIVDLGKPDVLIIRIGVDFYLKYILRILAFLVAGESGLRFKTLYGTYKKWPRNKILYSLLSTKFSKVNFIKKMIGASIVISATK